MGRTKTMTLLKNIMLNKKIFKWTVFLLNTVILGFLFLNEVFGYLEMPVGEFLLESLKVLLINPITWMYIVLFPLAIRKKLIIINSDPILSLALMLSLNMILFYILYLRPDFTSYVIFILLIFNSNMFYNEIINRLFVNIEELY